MLVMLPCPDDPLDTEGFADDPDVDCRVVDTPVFETAITAETAEAMMVHVGDQVMLHPDASDHLWALGALGQQEGYVLAISGIIELSDIDGKLWFADPALHPAPILTVYPTTEDWTATAVLQTLKDGTPSVHCKVNQGGLEINTHCLLADEPEQILRRLDEVLDA